MRFLVVDNGERLGWRIGEALRELGHEAIISPDPTHAVELARRLTVDAVVADLHMRAMTGIELAEALWLFECYVPMAFRQTVPSGEIVSLASEIGVLFPAAWTAADMERIVQVIAERRPRRLAEGSQTSLQPAAAGAGPVAAHAEERAWVLVPMHKLVRKLHVACRTWEQLEALCARHEAGRSHLTLRGTHRLAVGDRLMVVIELPSAVALSVPAAVRSVSCQGAASAYVIELIGLDRETCALLRASARSARAEPRHPRSGRPTGGTPAAALAPGRQAAGQPVREQPGCLAAAPSPGPENPLPELRRPGSEPSPVPARDPRAR